MTPHTPVTLGVHRHGAGPSAVVFHTLVLPPPHPPGPVVGKACPRLLPGGQPLVSTRHPLGGGCHSGARAWPSTNVLAGCLPEQRTPLFLAQEKLSHWQKEP